MQVTIRSDKNSIDVIDGLKRLIERGWQVELGIWQGTMQLTAKGPDENFWLEILSSAQVFTHDEEAENHFKIQHANPVGYAAQLLIEAEDKRHGR